MSFRYLIYDIETVVDKALLKRVCYADEDISDDEAYARELAVLAEKDPGRTFINPSFHMPVSIVAMAVNEDHSIQKLSPLGEPEFSVESRVRKFWSILSESKRTPVLVDFNGKGFDIRVLELWAYRLGIALPPGYFAKFGQRTRYNLDDHLDLHEFLTNHGAIRWKGGLDLFAKLVGAPGKGAVKGDQVEGLYREGRQFEIDSYCMGDVMDTYFVFLRVQVMRGAITSAQERGLVEKAKQFAETLSKETGYLTDYVKACAHEASLGDLESPQTPRV